MLQRVRIVFCLASNLKNMLQCIRRILKKYVKKYYYVSKRRTWRNGLQRVRKVLQVACKRYYNVSQTSCKLLAGDVTTYQEHLASYLGTLLQRIRNMFTVTWWRCYDVSIVSCKLLDENVTTYQELVTKFLLRIKETYLKKLLQRVRNGWQVAWRRCYNVSRTPCKLLDEDVATYRERLASHLRKLSQCDRNVFLKMSQRIKNVVQFTWQKCYNVSTPSCLLPVTWKICYNVSRGSSKDTCQKYFRYQKHVLEKILSTHQERLVNTLKEDAATYQARLANYLTNMLQRIKNVLQNTWRICYNVSGGSSKDTWQKYFYISKRRIWRICYNVGGTSCK